MQNVSYGGTGCANSQDSGPLTVQSLRQQVLAVLLGNPLFSDAEQLRANHFAHECEDAARLARWVVNVQVEAVSRAIAAARQRRAAATRCLVRQLRPAGFRGHYPPRPRLAPAWRPGTPLPCRPDYQAGLFDRLAAARFQPADSLTTARLPLIQPQ